MQETSIIKVLINKIFMSPPFQGRYIVIGSVPVPVRVCVQTCLLNISKTVKCNLSKFSGTFSYNNDNNNIDNNNNNVNNDNNNNDNDDDDDDDDDNDGTFMRKMAMLENLRL